MDPDYKPPTPEPIEVISDDEPVVIDVEDDEDVVEVSDTPIDFDPNLSNMVDDVQITGERPVRHPTRSPTPFVRRRLPPRTRSDMRRSRAAQQRTRHRLMAVYGNLMYDPRTGPRFRAISVSDTEESLRRHHLFVAEDEDAEFAMALAESMSSSATPEPDHIENSILQRIERENEAAMDSRLVKEKKFNQKALKEKQQAQVAPGYTTTIAPEALLGCELCGVTLGEGIPEEFRPDPRYNDNFEKYSREYNSMAPWFCAQVTQADRDLSKRVFAAKCGHVFCGRCVKNIGNKPRRTRVSKMTINNPHLYAPARCSAEGCQKRFTPKSFVEIYY